MIRTFFACLILFFANTGLPASAGEEGLTAEEVIPYLIGHWRFELGERTGGRIYTPLFDDQSANVDEYFHNAPFIGKGFFQYSANDGLFSSTLFFNVGVSDFTIGTFDGESQSITYQSVKPESEALEIVFHIIGPDHFEYNNYDADGKHIMHADFYRVK